MKIKWCILVSLLYQIVQAQERINNIFSEIKDDKYYIYYNLNGNEQEFFEINLEIFKDSTLILPKELSGDIGEGVQSGAMRVIIWDLLAEDIDLNGNFTFKISSIPSIGTFKSIYEEGKHTQNAVLMSLILPGLGGKKAFNNDFWWLNSITFFALASGSVITYLKAEKVYSDYSRVLYESESIPVYKEYSSYINATYALAGTAIFLWVSDIISVWYISNKNQSKKNNTKKKREVLD